MERHEQVEMVGDCYDGGLIDDAAALDILCEAAGISRVRAAWLLLLDARDRADDWVPLRDWGRWEAL